MTRPQHNFFQRKLGKTPRKGPVTAGSKNTQGHRCCFSRAPLVRTRRGLYSGRPALGPPARRGWELSNVNIRWLSHGIVQGPGKRAHSPHRPLNPGLVGSTPPVQSREKAHRRRPHALHVPAKRPHAPVNCSTRKIPPEGEAMRAADLWQESHDIKNPPRRSQRRPRLLPALLAHAPGHQDLLVTDHCTCSSAVLTRSFYQRPRIYNGLAFFGCPVNGPGHESCVAT